MPDNAPPPTPEINSDKTIYDRLTGTTAKVTALIVAASGLLAAFPPAYEKMQDTLCAIRPCIAPPISPEVCDRKKQYEDAAKSGDARAETLLGAIYENGDCQGIKQDFDKAMQEYIIASNHGDGKADTNIGTLYLLGRGVSQDIVAARRYFEIGAEKGDARGLTQLGALHQNGQANFKRDLAEAMRLYREAAQRGDPRGTTLIGALYENGDGVQKDCGIALENYKKASNEGDDRACTLIGALYERGCGVPRNLLEAKRWYDEGANRGDPRALLLRSALDHGETSAQLYSDLAAFRRAIQISATAYVRRLAWLGAAPGAP